MKKKLARALAAATTAALLCSAPAAATPAQDDLFWNILIANDIIPGPLAIQNAYKVCNAAWSGRASVRELVQAIYETNDLDYRHAELWVVAAIEVYCPPENETA